MDDLESSLTDVLSGGTRQVDFEVLLRLARVWLQLAMAGGGPGGGP